MAGGSEERQRPDRRRQARGGRRTGDTDSLAPLVLVIGETAAVTQLAEAVLAKLRFAVTTSHNADHAHRIFDGLRPDIVVASEQDADRFRNAPGNPHVLVMTEEMQQDPRKLVASIRESLRDEM